MKEGGLSVPPQKKPESMEDRDSGCDEVEEEDEDDSSDYTDSDDDRAPVQGNGLLE